MSRWRSPGGGDAEGGAADQVAPAPADDTTAAWPPPSPATASAAIPEPPSAFDQPAVSELGDELLRQAEAQRYHPAPVVDFDHDEIEAILRRASELGAHTHASVAELDSSTLADIATQVGIPVSAVAAAVAERRVGIDAETTFLDRLIGPDQIWAGRQSSASSEESNERVTEWLERGHGLRPRLTDDGVVIATRRSGLAGTVVRGVRTAQGKGGLGKVREVRGTAVSFDAGGAAEANDVASGRAPSGAHGGAVALVADLSDRRTSALAGGGAVTAVGAVAVGTIALVTTPIVLAALPVVAGAGVLTSRLAFRPTVRRVRNELDYTADQIARGKEAPTLLGDLTNPITDRLRRR